tara:strand:- start:2964 stop:3947 length:984 start_codon:yes stop_codon:yes gene_type:complete
MNKSQGLNSKNSRRLPVGLQASSHTIRAEMNADITEVDLGGDIDSAKGKDDTVKIDEPKTKGVNKDITILSAKSFKTFDVTTVPKNAFMIVIASRRSGKSHLITHFLEEYTSKNKVDGVFLFSKTNAGFEGIPSNYRYRDLDILPSIIDTQLRVKKHNETSKKRDKIESNIIIVLDDMLGAGGMASIMRKDPLLNKLSSNGRHLSSSHSNLMVILISQTFTGISPQIRLNTDLLLTTKLAARLEREKIVNSFLSLNSGRQGLSESYGVFDSIVNSDDFNFIAIHTTHQNKKKFTDYVYNFKAPSKLKNKKLTGNREDWKFNKKEIIF